ncbi:MAG: AgmX/PglI C-terminal domain-containing protein [Bdellovibrionales bacterium]
MSSKKPFKMVPVGILVISVTGFAAFLTKDSLHGWIMAKMQPKTKVTFLAENNQPSFQALVRGRTAEIQSCYNAQLKKGLNKSGKLVIKWLVSSEGRADDFVEEQNELGSPELYECARSAIQSWSFPKNRPTYIRHTFKMRNTTPDNVARAATEVEAE